MNLIAAVDRNWAIGKDNSLLVSIPEDMKFFRETTSGHVVVMGRKTLESFPNQSPLKNRINIVLTKDKAYKKEGAIIVHGIEELMTELGAYVNSEVYVIGGGSVYELMLPYCDTAYITKIDGEFEADAYLTNLDEHPQWEEVEKGGIRHYKDLSFSFCKYEKRPLKGGQKSSCRKTSSISRP